MAYHRRRHPPGPARRRQRGPVHRRRDRLRPAPHRLGTARGIRRPGHRSAVRPRPGHAAGLAGWPPHPRGPAGPGPDPARAALASAGPRPGRRRPVPAGGASAAGTAVRPGHRRRAWSPGSASPHAGTWPRPRDGKEVPPVRGGRFFSHLPAPGIARGTPAGGPAVQIAGSGKAARPAPASVGPPAPRTKPSTGRTPAKQSPPAPAASAGTRRQAARPGNALTRINNPAPHRERKGSKWPLTRQDRTGKGQKNSPVIHR